MRFLFCKSGTFFFLLVALACPRQGWSQELSALEAKDHVGQVATVCGVVASATFASHSKGQPTFLNLDRPYPKHIFTVVIWIEDRPKFGEPENDLAGHRICVRGHIKPFKGHPEIIARDPSQILSDE